MTTTIKSTSLDYDAIKNNLKTFLANKDEFSDYNFEASGLSNILDVLAWNTHYNALIANFALNESFLSTAQLRSSLVSLAQGVGYIPKSKTSARATVNLSVNLTGVTNRPNTIQLPSGQKFRTTVDDTNFTFFTLDNISATDDGNGFYRFTDGSGNTNITIYEGILRTKTFIVGEYDESPTYVIPDSDIDSTTAIVKVYESPSSSTFSVYTDIKNATVINDNTTLYILKEAPNGYWELTFGDGVTLGRAPEAGNKIVVEYLASSGPTANTASAFTPNQDVTVNNENYPLNIVTIVDAIGGDDAESTESIRQNAPFQYATQNRMVTAADYSSLVLRNFSTLIKDIKAWGGEDALKPKFGTVYLSVLFEDDVTDVTIDETKRSIQDLAEQLSVISFDLEFLDPVKTFIETRIFFQFNKKLTTLSQSTIESNVNNTINNYFANTIGGFDQSFRRSNLLTLIDEVDPSVLSSRAEVAMQQRINPVPGVLLDFNLRFPVPIAGPDDVNHTITSSTFVYDGKTCIIQNKLNDTKLEIISLEEQKVLVDNIGSYNPTDNTVSIVAFNPDSIIGGVNYIKISVTPANQSAITPQRNDILEYDSQPSFSKAVIVTST